jgi:spore coat polysaccharide biosynthesis protein SpsF
MIIAVIQARMGSSRFPGKVLKKFDGKELLIRQIERVKNSKFIEKLIVATTQLARDDDIYNLCKNHDIECFRGSEGDVLSRFYECAKQYGASTVIRLTGDCPLVDPEIIDLVVVKYLSEKLDFCANTVPPHSSTFPDGSDVEVFSFQALEKAYNEIDDIHLKEHVTFQFWKTNDYKSSQYHAPINLSNFRYTVDYPEDYEVVKYIFKQIAKNNLSGRLSEIIHILEDNPAIQKLNSQHSFGQGWRI